MSSESDDNVFDEVMLQVGYSGKFQKIYNYTFNLVFVFVATMASFNTIISLSTPEHWCKVPGREANMSLDLWKNLTIPRTNSSESEFSQCSMFNKSDGSSVIDCLHGWEYDQTYYTQTIVSQENWVCGSKMHATNLLVVGKIGEILGTVFSQLGDIYGRRPIFYAGIVSVVVGRLGLLVSKGFFLLFVAFLIIGNLSGMALFQAPLVISVEISSVEDRAMIPLLQCVGWTLGLCVSPLIFWWLGDWIPFTVITTVPVLIFLFFRPYMIESPRWLASKGKIKECVVELKKIAKINRTQLSDKVLVTLNNKSVAEEKNFGVMSLFGSWKLAKKSLLIISSWICQMMIYFILFFNVSNLKGNPFMNYFWQGLGELPGYFLGKYLSDAIGRKYTRFGAFIAIGIVAIILAYVLSFSGNVIIITVCGILMKCLSSVAFYAMNLQTLEIYPTCLRQTGSSIGYLVASLFGILTPYVTYLGTAINAGLPYVIIVVLAAAGAIFGMFIPETLNEKLPESIREAEEFGADQRVWAFPRGKIFTHKTVPNNVI
ncbi:beta-alanine transporter isoform X1 [Tribolium madens]|uniref:beta-alanine transporter isoform X1 n=1 Tax=Tribolium madens TaxID=41895 RepID=UPI001CF72F82|nr:beta-alanine transporter isoform X1 [Tribolium madens]